MQPGAQVAIPCTTDQSSQIAITHDPARVMAHNIGSGRRSTSSVPAAGINPSALSQIAI